MTRIMLATQYASPLPTVAGDLSSEGQNLRLCGPCSLMLLVSERNTVFAYYLGQSGLAGSLYT